MLSGCATVVTISDSVVVIDSQAPPSILHMDLGSTTNLELANESSSPLAEFLHSSGSTPSAPHKSQAM
ncbi:hypothetical protein PGT21_021033 [Puccinia graminis f. sp. tritici]|uniref:Uncharacterized protein n=1 Tax=Puccinia graminis f. sp. tritici TaxID=56615 RepID=A0A5B0QY88_PUCGR|nr:hypothetical protein PGT21_021033 [Puccinia graminis f. sp. tritici]